MEKWMESLLSLALFQSLSMEDLRILWGKGLMEASVFKRKEIVCLQDEPCDSFDVLVKGRIAAIHLEETGHLLPLEEFQAGDVLGANLLFSDRAYYPMTLTAAEETVLMRFKKTAVLDLIMQDENFLLIFLAAVSEKTIMLTETISQLIKPNLRSRILHYLTREMKRTGERKVLLRCSKKQLAEKLLVERTSLSRELQKMREEGVIEFDRTSITICKTDVF